MTDVEAASADCFVVIILVMEKVDENRLVAFEWYQP